MPDNYEQFVDIKFINHNESNPAHTTRSLTNLIFAFKTFAVRTKNKISFQIAKFFTPSCLTQQFDEQIYLSQNHDVSDAIHKRILESGLQHWIMKGYKEYLSGVRKPGFFEYDSLFQEHLYLASNPDVSQAIKNRQFISGYHHWVLHGEKEFKSGIRRAGFIEKQQFKEWAPLRGAPNKHKALKAHNEYFKKFLQKQVPLELPQYDNPIISVIIVLHNQAALSLQCLQALQQNHDVPFEIIIVDNNSSDETLLLLEKIKGATVFKNSENCFFIEAVNQALPYCRGEYVLLLNNDAAIEPECLSQALKTFQTATDIGAVGGKVLLSDGTLQEAGSIIWNDGSCYGYGRHGNPDSPQYNFQRTVDFCSAVFLLINKNLFIQLGGFNNNLYPMYYEDVDLCLRLRAEGFRTVYNPNIKINHFEFGSSASNTWRQNLLITNQQKIRTWHTNFLKSKPIFTNERILHSRSNINDTPKVLFIEDDVPLKKFGAGHPRSQKILNILSEMGAHTTLCSMKRTQSGVFSETISWTEIYSEISPEVEVFKDFDSSLLEGFLQERKTFYDFIIIFRPHNMKSLVEIFDKNPSIFNGTKIIYDAEALYANRIIQEKKITNTLPPHEEIQRSLNREISYTAIADTVFAVSQQEACFFEKSHSNVKVIGYPIETTLSHTPFSMRSNILFIGAFHDDDSPNTDAVCWFIKEVLPLININRAIPIKISIVGTCTSSKVKNLQSDTVTVLGFIENISPLCDRHRFLIAPMRFAAGIPLKVIEAASMGLPVIGTKLVSDLLGWRN